MKKGTGGRHSRARPSGPPVVLLPFYTLPFSVTGYCPSVPATHARLTRATR